MLTCALPASSTNLCSTRLDSASRWLGRCHHPTPLPAGHQAVRLGPGQQHTVTVALSSADCAARRQEKGVLQQLLLLVFAATPHTATARALAGIAGVAAADCPADWAAEAGGTGAAAGLASQAGPGPPPFRLFVVARRVTAALVDRPADLAVMMSPEAKPYIAGKCCPGP